MLQANLKVQILLFLLCLCKSFFQHDAQVGARIKVDYSNVKNCNDSPLPEYVGACVSPRLCRYRNLSHPPIQLSLYVSRPTISPAPLGLSVNVCTAFGYLHLLQRYPPGTLTLYCPTFDLRFVGYSTWG